MAMNRMTNEMARTRQEDVDIRFEIYRFASMDKQSEEGRFPGRDLDSPSSMKVLQVLPIRSPTFCHIGGREKLVSERGWKL